MKILLLALLITFSFTLHAEQSQNAYGACKSAEANDQCEYLSLHGVVKGTCQEPAKDRKLICTPKGHRIGDSVHKEAYTNEPL